MDTQTQMPQEVPQQMGNFATSAPPKAPLFVVITAWLMLLGGLGVLLFSGFSFLISIASGEWLRIISGFIDVAVAIGLIVVSFGLRHMRKWALYVYTVMIAVSLIWWMYRFIAGELDLETGEIIAIAVEVGVLAYFWVIYKKFV